MLVLTVLQVLGIEGAPLSQDEEAEQDQQGNTTFVRKVLPSQHSAWTRR
jgi:hypothetical protein